MTTNTFSSNELIGKWIVFKPYKRAAIIAKVSKIRGNIVFFKDRPALELEIAEVQEMPIFLTQKQAQEHIKVTK